MSAIQWQVYGRQDGVGTREGGISIVRLTRTVTRKYSGANFFFAAALPAFFVPPPGSAGSAAAGSKSRSAVPEPPLGLKPQFQHNRSARADHLIDRDSNEETPRRVTTAMVLAEAGGREAGGTDDGVGRSERAGGGSK